MRIIAGRLRGRRLPTGGRIEGLRPISGRIKQSLFDILKVRIAGSRFLDLFAGTGAVGIEALSRGAEFAAFVDYDRRHVQALEQNLERAGLSDRASVLRANVLEDLSFIRFRCRVPLYDIVFTGPPYKDAEKRPLAYTVPALCKIVEAGLLAPDAWIVSQHHVKEAVEPVEGLELFRREKYGDSFLSFLRKPAQLIAG